MRRNLPWICASALLVVGLAAGSEPLAASPSDTLLVFLRGANLARVRDIPSFAALHFSDSRVFGKVAAVDTHLLRTAAEHLEVVEEVPAGKPLYWARAAGPGQPLPEGVPVRVLVRSDGELLVQAEPSAAAELASAGFQLELVQRYPKPLPPETAPHFWIPVAYDTLVQRIADEVSAVSLRQIVARLQAFQTRYTYSDSIISAGKWLFDQFRSFGYEEVYFDSFYVDGRPHRNVIAIKRGLFYPDSVIMLGGHYDSIVLGTGANPSVWAPGADDNASGTAAALEAAKILAEHRFEATIQFACWDAEEIGLVGSTSYAQKLAQRKRPLSFYMNFDMIGNLDRNDPEWDVTIFTDERARPYAEFIAEVARLYTPLVPYIPGNSGGSDHRPFQLLGYPALYVQEGDFSPHWHRPTDTLENMNFEYMRDVVRTGVAAAIHLAGLADGFGDVPYVKYLSHKFDDDPLGLSAGNGNGYADAGERLEIQVQVKNYGPRPGRQLYARLETQDPFARILVDSVSIPDVNGGEAAQIASPFVAEIRPDAPNGHEIDFRLVVGDAFGHRWTSHFGATVQMPELAFSRQAVRERQGNGDEEVDAGEEWAILVEVQNHGLRPTGYLTGILRSLAPTILVLDSTASFDPVPVGGRGSNSAEYFIVRVSPAAARGEIVPLELRLRESGGFYEAKVEFFLAVGQGAVLFVEDDGTADFSALYAAALNLSGIPFRHWDTAHEGPVPADTLAKYRRVVWYVGTEYGNSLFRAGTATLENYLAHGGRLFLSGPAAIFVLRTKPLFSQYLRISYVNYNTGLHRVTTEGSNEVLGEMAFWLAKDGPNKQGMPTEIEVSAPALPILYYDRRTYEGAGDIRAHGIAAAAVADSGYRAVYFAFGWEGIEGDEERRAALVRILNWLQGDLAGVSEQVADVPIVFQLEPNYPNPFNPQTAIRFTLPERSWVKLELFDSRGRVVRVLLEGERSSGRHVVTWDGRDELGNSLPSGVYFCALRAGGRQAVRKLVLVR
jgi:hypothetical protein